MDNYQYIVRQRDVVFLGDTITIFVDMAEEFQDFQIKPTMIWAEVKIFPEHRALFLIPPLEI